MSSLKLFSNKTLYEILELPQDAQIQDVKKQYYKLALIHHPDRVGADRKSKAKEEFTIIHQAYTILSDVEKKKAYDDGLDVFLTRATVSAQWESHLKTITRDDIDRARQQYQGSEGEKRDIMREAIRGNGSLTHLLNSIPFMRIEDEVRVTQIVKDLVKDGKIPNIKIKKMSKRR